MKKKILSNRELSSFCEQMSMILNSGITPIDGLNLMLSDASDKYTAQVLSDVIEHTKEGNGFGNALEASGYFPDYVISMTKIGEESGSTDTIMTTLADYYSHEESISDSIRSAVTYPLIMVIMMFFIIIILITRVLPLFDQVYLQLGAHMSGLSALLLSLGKKLQAYSLILLITLAVILVVALIISFTPFGRNLLKKIRENSSLTSNFYKDIAYGRFAGGMSLMLKSGIGIFQALDMVSRLVNNGPVEAQIKDCKRNIEEGCNFAEALNKSSIFSRLYSRMISVGVKTGDVDKVLDKISNLYERETDRKIQSFISIIEPTLVIILSLVVGIILLSVIFPLLGVMTGID